MLHFQVVRTSPGGATLSNKMNNTVHYRHVRHTLALMCAKNHLLIFSSFLDIWENVEWPRFFWTTLYFIGNSSNISGNTSKQYNTILNSTPAMEQSIMMACMLDCPLACLRNHTINSRKFSVQLDSGHCSVVLQQHCNTLHTSSIVDDVMFAHNWPVKGDASRTSTKVSNQGAAPDQGQNLTSMITLFRVMSYNMLLAC